MPPTPSVPVMYGRTVLEGGSMAIPTGVEEAVVEPPRFVAVTRHVTARPASYGVRRYVAAVCPTSGMLSRSQA